MAYVAYLMPLGLQGNLNVYLHVFLYYPTRIRM